MGELQGYYTWMDDTGDFLNEVNAAWDCDFFVEKEGVVVNCDFGNLDQSPGVSRESDLPDDIPDKGGNYPIYDIEYAEFELMDEIVISRFSFKATTRYPRVKDISAFKDDLTEEVNEVIGRIRKG